MTTCPKCGASAMAGSFECFRCGVIFSKIKHEPPPAEALGPSGEVPEIATLVEPSHRFAFNIPIQFYFFAILLGAAWYWHRPTPFPEFADQDLSLGHGSRDVAAAETADPCANRPTCVYLYVAPWCPHCHDFLPHINEIRGYWHSENRPGLKVVIGWDQAAEIQKMSELIEAPRFVDSKESFRKSLKISSVPYMIVVDNNRKIVAQGGSAMQWMNDEINSHLREH